MNTELLYRFIQGLCSEAEIQEVNRLLEEDSSFKAEYDMLCAIEHSVQSYQYPNSSNKDLVWDKIVKPNTRRIIPIYRQNWFKAAAMLVVLFTAVLIYRNVEPQKDILTIKANQQGEMFDLPDGSKVWLQNGAELQYHDNQKKNIREATLAGVGFFVVKPNDDKKFEVTNSHLKVLVVGTAFEINGASVTVDHGAVQVTAPSMSDTMMLQAMDKVVLSDEAWISSKVDSEVGLWRNQGLKFKDQPLSTIVASIEKQYQIRVIFEPSLLQETFTLDFEGLDLEEVMQLLESVTGTKYKNSNQEYRFKR